MQVNSLQPYEHEWVEMCRDDESGLTAIIAIHDTRLGPAFGGCRMWPYASMNEALEDALRLSRGMTYKNALADLPFGGGKSVLVGDSRREKTAAKLRAFGRLVDKLNGRYITAEDVGTTVDDMEIIARETRYVAGRRQTGTKAGGNPSPKTAYGVFLGIKAALRHVFGDDSLRGRRVAVQGVGTVGEALCGYLAEAGADLTIADINADRVETVRRQTGAAVSTVKEILYTRADVVAPCALGAALNKDSIPYLNAPIVAGAANNQLARDEDGERLAELGILYAPDFVINAGGIINAAAEYQGNADESAVWRKIGIIADNLDLIFKRATADRRATHQIAIELAREKLRSGRSRAA